MSAQLASIVPPVYNQESRIQTVLEEYVTGLQRLHIPFELLPVINGPRHKPRAIYFASQIRHALHRASARRLGSLLYNLECRALFDLPSWDINGTPKVFSRSLVSESFTAQSV